MKKFKFKFTRLTTVFIILGLVLAVAAAGVNTYFLVTDGVKTAANAAYPIIRYTLMYFVAALLLVILFSLLFSSYYEINGKTLKTSFGIIKSKYDLETVNTVALDRKTNKLSVYFENDNFIVIAVKDEWYNDFVDAIIKANPKIEYSIQSKENTPDDEIKK